MALSFIIPGLDEVASEKIIGILQERLSQEQEAALVLKHAHWNVAGPNFIAVHEMLDPQVDEVLAMADETAERIAALGGSPSGRPDDIVRYRTWDKFELEGRQNTLDYLRALDKYYDSFIKADRTAIKELDDLDVIRSCRITCSSLSSSSGSCARSSSTERFVPMQCGLHSFVSGGHIHYSLRHIHPAKIDGEQTHSA